MISQHVSARYLIYLQWLAAPYAFKITNASIKKLRNFFVRGRDITMYWNIRTQMGIYFEQGYR